MADEQVSQQEHPRMAMGGRRWLGVLTVLFAVGWVFWAHVAAEHVRDANMTRAVAAAMFGRGDGDAGVRSPLEALLGNRPRPVTTRPISDGKSDLLGQQMAWVEGIAKWWEWSMRGVGILLVLGGLTAAAGHGRGSLTRGALMVAGSVIVLATLGTLVCLWAVMRPEWGDLPPLSIWTYVLIGIVQSAYGAVLLIGGVGGRRIEFRG
jgi:hypothetical protein